MPRIIPLELLSNEAIISRFWANVDKTDTCWIWKAAKNDNGYGLFAIVKGWTILVHRISFFSTFPNEDQRNDVLHSCDTPACVRPEHLFLGNQTANMHDMISKHRGGNGQRVCLSKQDVLMIALRARSGENQQLIASDYGINQSTVSRITRGERRKDVTNCKP